MSAFVVPKTHIDALIALAILGPRGRRNRHVGPLTWYSVDPRVCKTVQEMQAFYRQASSEGADELGWMLVKENVASVLYNYGEGSGDMIPAELAVRYHWARPLHDRMPNAVEGLKIVDCYEYQACEHPEWHGSEALRFCEALRASLIRDLPDYDEAAGWPWKGLPTALQGGQR